MCSDTYKKYLMTTVEKLTGIYCFLAYAGRSESFGTRPDREIFHTSVSLPRKESYLSPDWDWLRRYTRYMLETVDNCYNHMGAESEEIQDLESHYIYLISTNGRPSSVCKCVKCCFFTQILMTTNEVQHIVILNYNCKYNMICFVLPTPSTML